MGDPFQHVRSGETIRLSATAHNATLDAARDYLRRRRSASGEAGGAAPPSGVVLLIRNDSGGDLDRFSVLGVNGVIFTRDENEEGFENAPALVGVTPTADHVGWFAVLLEPVADGAIGRGMVQGVVPVQVQVPEGGENQWWADVVPDETGSLLLASWGAACVLWRETGTGLKWALVRLGSISSLVPPGTADYQIPVWSEDDAAYVPGPLGAM